MRIGVIGIGGIGGFVGAHLAREYAGKGKHSIVFIQRGSHGAEIVKKGLTFSAKESYTVNPDVLSETIENTGIFDVLIFCTKSKDLEQTALLAIPAIHENTCIISLLNGVNNAQRLQKIFPNNRVLEGCIYVSAAIVEPGVVNQKGGAGTIFFGPIHGNINELDKQIHSILLQAHLKAVLTDTILHEVWKKYLFICPFATMTSLYNLPIGKIVRDYEKLEQTKRLVSEIVEISSCFNAQITQSDIDSVFELAFKIPESTPSSMQLDVYSGKIPEIDVFAENVVNLSIENGIIAPEHVKVLPILQMIIKKQLHG